MILGTDMANKLSLYIALSSFKHLILREPRDHLQQRLTFTSNSYTVCLTVCSIVAISCLLSFLTFYLSLPLPCYLSPYLSCSLNHVMRGWVVAHCKFHLCQVSHFLAVARGETPAGGSKATLWSESSWQRAMREQVFERRIAVSKCEYSHPNRD